jgi:uncharacterized membrane protein
MADVPVQVIVAAFNDLNGASQALKSLKEAKKERLIEIEDAAVLTKDADGKVKIKETADMRAGKGATIGAIAGGVVGLLAGPVGWAALGGGVIGGLAAKLHDGGFPDDRLRQLAEGLTPNSSALVAVIDHRWVADLERELARQGADVVTEGLRDDIAARLKEGGGIVYTVVDTGEAIVAGPGPQEEAASSADTTDAGATPPPPDDSALGQTLQPQQPA